MNRDREDWLALVRAVQRYARHKYGTVATGISITLVGARLPHFEPIPTCLDSEEDRLRDVPLGREEVKDAGGHVLMPAGLEAAHEP